MNTKVKKTLKFFLYLFGKLFAAAAVVGIAWFAFATALNSSNVYVAVKDAFAKRASVILEPLDNPDTELLYKLFTESFLKKTGLDTQQDNKYYSVTLFSQRTDVKAAVVFPTAKKAEMIVTDVIEDVRASLVNEDDPGFVQKESLINSGRYKVTAVKTEDNGWLIDDIELLEEIQPEFVRPLPTPSSAAEEYAAVQDDASVQ